MGLAGRSPHGERGLKSARSLSQHPAQPSLPSRGAWIEIKRGRVCLSPLRIGPPTGNVDRIVKERRKIGNNREFSVRAFVRIISALGLGHHRTIVSAAFAQSFAPSVQL